MDHNSVVDDVDQPKLGAVEDKHDNVAPHVMDSVGAHHLSDPEMIKVVSVAQPEAHAHPPVQGAQHVHIRPHGGNQDAFEAHKQYHEKHRGHESMHMEMMLVLFVVLIIAQVILIKWKQLHFRSYQLATLVGMWIIPVLMCLKLGWYRFGVVWLIFTAISALFCFLATRKPLAPQTPRRIYKWFILIYKASYALGVLGYVLIMLSLFGATLIFLIEPARGMEWGVLLLFYGLYFGVVGRDVAEVVTDLLASQVGYSPNGSMPTRKLETGVCAVCAQPLGSAPQKPPTISNPHNAASLAPQAPTTPYFYNANSAYYDPYRQNNEAVGRYNAEANEAFNDAFASEKTYKLTCNHVFHEFCIRGWCMIGKKQTCPYCKERVDLKHMFANPWQRPHLLYGSLLDWIRYLVCWQPVIFGLVQLVNWLLGLE